jgi:tetratricopeptide (TPR) repeat protein
MPKDPRSGKPAAPHGAAPDIDRAVAAEVRNVARPGSANQAEALVRTAIAALIDDDVPAAVDAARRAKVLAQRSSAVREVLGIAFYRSARYREAATELLSYRRMTGRVDQNHLIADAYRGLGAPQKAIPLINEELAADLPAQAHAEAAVVGGGALADLGRYPEALAILRSFPTTPDVGSSYDLRVWYVTADVLLRAGRPDEAAELLRLIQRHDPGAFDVDDRLAEAAAPGSRTTGSASATPPPA